MAADEARRSWKPRFNDSSVPLGQSLHQPGCLVEEDLARNVRHLSAVGAWPGADNRRVDGLVEAAKELSFLSGRHGWKVREIVAGPDLWGFRVRAQECAAFQRIAVNPTSAARPEPAETYGENDPERRESRLR